MQSYIYMLYSDSQFLYLLIFLMKRKGKKVKNPDKKKGKERLLTNCKSLINN